MKLLYFLLLYSVAVGFLFSAGRAEDVALSAPKNQAKVLSAVDQSVHPGLVYINSIRVSRGLNELTYSNEAGNVARIRLDEMINESLYSHKRKDGSDYTSLFQDSEIRRKYSCENLQLQQYDSLESAVDAWLSSVSHRTCLLNPQIRYAALDNQLFDDSVVFEYSDIPLFLFVFISHE